MSSPSVPVMTQGNSDWLKSISYPTSPADAPHQIEIVGVDGTPVFIGTADLKFRDVQFVPGPDNVGSVFIQTYDETTDAFADTVPNGEVKTGSQGIDWPPPDEGFWSGQSFKARFTNAGDKLVVVFVK